MRIIADRDGSPDPVLASALGIVTVACLAILAMIGFAAWAAWLRADHVLDFVQLGAGIKETMLGVSVLLAAVAAYWASDGINAKKSAEAKG